MKVSLPLAQPQNYSLTQNPIPPTRKYSPALQPPLTKEQIAHKAAAARWGKKPQFMSAFLTGAFLGSETFQRFLPQTPFSKANKKETGRSDQKKQQSCYHCC